MQCRPPQVQHKYNGRGATEQNVERKKIGNKYARDERFYNRENPTYGRFVIAKYYYYIYRDNSLPYYYYAQKNLDHDRKVLCENCVMEKLTYRISSEGGKKKKKNKKKIFGVLN